MAGAAGAPALIQLNYPIPEGAVDIVWIVAAFENEVLEGLQPQYP